MNIKELKEIIHDLDDTVEVKLMNFNHRYAEEDQDELEAASQIPDYEMRIQENTLYIIGLE